MVHDGNGPGLNPIALGQRAGAETVTLITNNLPSHTHVATTNVTATLRGTNNTGGSAEPGGNVSAESLRVYNVGPANVDMGPSAIVVAAPTTTTANTGNGQAFNIRNPYLGIRHCVALDGQFPPRN